jgi:ParB-like chromosome segregation protein Spo0J
MTATKGLEFHPLAETFPLMEGEDFKTLKHDIRDNGQREPIVLYQDKILDGRNRYLACIDLGLEPQTKLFTDSDPLRFVISMNIHRRHLSPDQRRNIIAKLLKTDPTKSNRQIAQEAKADHKTVGAERERLQSSGEIPQLETTTGADGRTRKRKGGKLRGGGAKGRKEMISYREVVDGKTAANAYSVLEEHLLDALQDLNDLSSFDHADEYGQATIEKLQEKLSRMQPHEAAAA